MDAAIHSPLEAVARLYGEEALASDLIGWFAVQGDMDDFIFFNGDETDTGGD